MAEPIKAGDHVEILDAYGEWRRAAACSGVEGTHDADGRKIHDFPVVWVGIPALPEPVRIPWPADAVRLAPPGVPDDFGKLLGGDPSVTDQGAEARKGGG